MDLNKNSKINNFNSKYNDKKFFSFEDFNSCSNLIFTKILSNYINQLIFLKKHSY